MGHTVIIILLRGKILFICGGVVEICTLDFPDDSGEVHCHGIVVQLLFERFGGIDLSEFHGLIFICSTKESVDSIPRRDDPAKRLRDVHFSFAVIPVIPVIDQESHSPLHLLFDQRTRQWQREVIVRNVHRSLLRITSRTVQLNERLNRRTPWNGRWR